MRHLNIFPEKVDQTMNYQTLAWIDDISIVKRRDEEKHSGNYLKRLINFKKADTGQTKKSEFFLKETI